MEKLLIFFTLIATFTILVHTLFWTGVNDMHLNIIFSTVHNSMVNQHPDITYCFTG